VHQQCEYKELSCAGLAHKKVGKKEAEAWKNGECVEQTCEFEWSDARRKEENEWRASFERGEDGLKSMGWAEDRNGLVRHNHTVHLINVGPDPGGRTRAYRLKMMMNGTSIAMSNNGQTKSGKNQDSGECAIARKMRPPSQTTA
jgi:hypothetical protein